MKTRDEAAQRFIDSLAERQRQLDLSDAQMAEQMGVSRPLWTLTKSGKRRLGLSLLEGASQAYPELASEVLAFFSPRKVTIRTSEGTVRTEVVR